MHTQFPSKTKELPLYDLLTWYKIYKIILTNIWQLFFSITYLCTQHSLHGIFLNILRHKGSNLEDNSCGYFHPELKLFFHGVFAGKQG